MKKPLITTSVQNSSPRFRFKILQVFHWHLKISLQVLQVFYYFSLIFIWFLNPLNTQWLVRARKHERFIKKKQTKKKKHPHQSAEHQREEPRPGSAHVLRPLGWGILQLRIWHLRASAWSVCGGCSVSPSAAPTSRGGDVTLVDFAMDVWKCLVNWLPVSRGWETGGKAGPPGLVHQPPDI